MRERTDLDKKPIWYLFLGANVIVLLGCAITYVLFAKDPKNSFVNFVPSLVCNIIALILAGIFIWFEAKETMPKIVHFRKKWLWWYLAALIVFVVAIIFNFSFLIIFNDMFWRPINPGTWPLIIYLVITGVLTLVSIGLQRYARYKIDLDIYRRKHGELPKKEEMEKEEAKHNKEQKSEPIKDDTTKATSGLADSIDKQ